MRRRDFLRVLGGATAFWPVATRAQQPERVRRISVLSSTTMDDPNDQGRRAGFQQGLQQLGWNDGGNVQIDYRWGEGNADAIRKYAAEFVALAPDVILAGPGTVELLL